MGYYDNIGLVEAESMGGDIGSTLVIYSMEDADD